MKRVWLFVMVALFTLSGCLTLFESYSTGSLSTHSGGFIFSTGTVVIGDTSDIILEPWYNDNGEFSPGLMTFLWGDSTIELLDMGEVSISAAMSMDLSEGKHGYDLWTIWPVEVGHTYTMKEIVGDKRVYFHIDDMKIDESGEYPVATIYFSYKETDE